MPRRRKNQRKQKRYRRRRGGNVLHPPGGPPVDIPLNIAVPPIIEPAAPIVQYRRPRMGPLTQVKAFLKRNRIISRGLNALGARSLGNRVYQMGYGKSGGCRF